MSWLVRYATLIFCAILLIVAVAFAQAAVFLWAAIGILAALCLLGLYDMLQRRHSILRNYPVIGHVRWIAEFVRPEIRQYLVEADEEAAPFSRSQRSLVYERAKGEAGEHPFGTLLDVYEDGYEFIGHSTVPAVAADPDSFRITIGGAQCARPYSASVFNISAMSFGAISANAIRALNAGARRGGFSHDTGEGSISPYHLEMGGDIVWEVASGYFGCRTEDGRFDPDRFAEQARLDQIKMIEIKLSQGAKPGHGGVLPAAKVTAGDRADPRRPHGPGLRLSGAAQRLHDTDRDDELHHPTSHPVWRQAGRVQALRRPSVGLHGDRQGHAGDRRHPRLCRGRWGRRRHRRRADGVQRPHRRPHARGAAVRAQHPGRRRATRPDENRRGRQDRQRLRHRQRAGHRRRLGQRGARLHVRRGLRAVGPVQHQSLSDRRRHPGQAAPEPPWSFPTRPSGSTTSIG